MILCAYSESVKTHVLSPECRLQGARHMTHVRHLAGQPVGHLVVAVKTGQKTDFRIDGEVERGKEDKRE